MATKSQPNSLLPVVTFFGLSVKRPSFGLAYEESAMNVNGILLTRKASTRCMQMQNLPSFFFLFERVKYRSFKFGITNTASLLKQLRKVGLSHICVWSIGLSSLVLKWHTLLVQSWGKNIYARENFLYVLTIYMYLYFHLI